MVTVQTENSDGLGDRIKIAIGSENPHSFARRAGLKDSTIRSLLKARNAGADKLVAIARAADVSLWWLATGESHPERELPQLGHDFVLVPRYDIEASAGPGALSESENVIDYMAFQEGWVRRTLGLEPARLALISAKGDSMEPTIRAGDLLLVDTSVREVEDDAIYIVVMDGHLMVKRLQRFVGGVVSVKSDNAAYVEQTLSAEELAAYAVVTGRVRWIGRLT